MAEVNSYAKDSVLLELDITTGIAHLILNRPRSLNAINVDLLSGFVSALQDVKVVLLISQAIVSLKYIPTLPPSFPYFRTPR